MKKQVKKIFSPPSLRLNATALIEVVFLLSVLLAVLFYFSRKTLKQEATWDAEQALEATEQCVDNVLLSVEQSAGNVYWDLMAHLDEPDRMELYCRSLVECNENIMGCAIGFKPGFYPDREQALAYVHRRQYDSNELVVKDTVGNCPYTEQQWYQSTIEKGRSGWSVYKRSDGEGASGIVFCLPIYTGIRLYVPDNRSQIPDSSGVRERQSPQITNDHIVGVLAVNVSVGLFSKIIQASKPSPNSFNFLLGQDGSFIAHPDPEILSKYSLSTIKKADVSPAIVEAGEDMVAGKKGNKSFVGKNGKMHVFYKPFVRSGVPGRSMEDLKWSIAIVYPDGDIFGGYNNMLYQVMKVAFFGLLLFYVLSRFVTRRQLKPLDMLTESAQRIAEGDYSEEIPKTKRNDEIGQLQRHFIHMKQSLATHVGELEQLKATLEKRRETLRKTYEQTQEDDRVITTFLRRMTDQLIAPTDAIKNSVYNLCDNYQRITVEEANQEVANIKQHSMKTTELMNQMFSRGMVHHAYMADGLAGDMVSDGADAAPDTESDMLDSAPTKSLSKKLSRSLMLMAVPIFLLALGSYYRHTNDVIHAEAVERSSSILNTTVQRVVSFMNAIETAAKSNVWLMEENFDPDSLQAVSRRIVTLNRSVLSSSVSTEPDMFPQCGRYFSVYSVNEGDTVITVRESDFDYFDKVWYKTTLHSGRPSWVDPFSDFNEGTINYNDAVASFCIPLRPKKMAVNGQRPIAGVVSSDFSFNRLAERILATEHPYPGAYYMLIGTDGRYLVHPETRLLFKKTIFSETDPVSHPDVMALGQEMTLGKEGTMHVTIDDVLCHVSYAPIPDTNWSLALVCPDKEILADYHYLGYLLIGLVILGLFLIRWLTYRVVKQNIKPVNQLLEITEKITEGNYDEVIPRSDRKDAIAKMQNGFADMQQSIITHMKDIAHATEELKMQTAELEEAVKEADEAARKRELFIQNVLHQINTPLNIIEVLANVLRKSLANRNLNGKLSVGVVLPSLEGDLQPVGGDLQSPTELGSIASTMKHNANILNRKMLMLFDCSNTSAAGGTLYHRGDKVACNAVAQECIDHTNSLFQGLTIRFETEVPDSLCIQTNHLYLMRTLREPVYNAAKYSDGQHIVVRVTQTDTTVRFIVEDVGPGLPKEWQELVNQPFAKVNEQSEGLGLGLPLSKRHAIGLGGDLIYDPDYEGGCRFIVEVPKQ